MKNSIILIATLILSILGISTLHAQDIPPELNNYLVLSKNIKQLKPVLLTAQELAIEDGEQFGEFQLIICGKTVTDIPNNSEFTELLAQAKLQNVKVVACGLSLKKFKVNQDQLPSQMSVVKNGILHSFQLKKKGYFTLTI
jgi:intracellular sulfur oxidation DsrE/DsrF family protein